MDAPRGSGVPSVRVLIARGSTGRAAMLGTIASAQPDIAAITSVTPADACMLASEASLRYAVQHWEDDPFGKAILWKPSLGLRGARRIDFTKSPMRSSSPTRGLLKIGLEDEGRQLDVLCVQFSREPLEAELQLVAAAREVAELDRPTIVAADSGGCDPGLLPSLRDVWMTARWHSISIPSGEDLANATRNAFGLPSTSAETDHARYSRHRLPQLRLLHSAHLSVVRASRIADERIDLVHAALVADVALPVNAFG
jgi:hypothetical protein